MQQGKHNQGELPLKICWVKFHPFANFSPFQKHVQKQNNAKTPPEFVFYFLPLVGNANIKINTKQQKYAMNAPIMLHKYIKSMYQHQK